MRRLAITQKPFRYLSTRLFIYALKYENVTQVQRPEKKMYKLKDVRKCKSLKVSRQSDIVLTDWLSFE